MGQYFIIVNETKKEFIHPHEFGDGLKLLEFGCGSYSTLTALTLLLRKSNEEGGGDFYEHEKYKIVGSWGGDKIVIIGDYDKSGLYDKAREKYKNISKEIAKVVKKIRKDDGVDEEQEKPTLRPDILIGVKQ